MAFRKITNYSANIKDLPNRPSDAGISAAELKALFDGRTDKEIKQIFNALIDELIMKSAAGQLGADNISEDDCSEPNIQAKLIYIREYVNTFVDTTIRKLKDEMLKSEQAALIGAEKLAEDDVSEATIQAKLIYLRNYVNTFAEQTVSALKNSMLEENQASITGAARLSEDDTSMANVQAKLVYLRNYVDSFVDTTISNLRSAMLESEQASLIGAEKLTEDDHSEANVQAKFSFVQEQITEGKNRIQPVEKGGTGATTAKEARANLGVKGCIIYDERLYEMPSAEWTMIAGNQGTTTTMPAVMAFARNGFDKDGSLSHFVSTKDFKKWTTLSISRYTDKTPLALYRNGDYYYLLFRNDSNNGLTLYRTTNGTTLSSQRHTYSAGEKITEIRAVAVGDSITFALAKTEANPSKTTILAINDSTKTISIAAVIDAYLTDIAYGDGKFVATARNSINVYLWLGEESGWMTSTMTFSTDWISVAYGNQTFVAVSEESGHIVRSYDGGLSWEPAMLGVDNAMWKGVEFNGTHFVVYASDFGSVLRSDLGVYWTYETVSYEYWLGYAKTNIGEVIVARYGITTVKVGDAWSDRYTVYETSEGLDVTSALKRLIKDTMAEASATQT